MKKKKMIRSLDPLGAQTPVGFVFHFFFCVKKKKKKKVTPLALCYVVCALLIRKQDNGNFSLYLSDLMMCKSACFVALFCICVLW